MSVAHIVLRIAKSATIVAAFVAAAGAGILSGVLFAYAGDLPQITALDNYNPSTITRVYSAQGQLIGEFATQRRVIVSYDDINPLLREAIIATEDASFEHHFGLNVKRIFAAIITDVIERRRAQGASTITQQVARNLDQLGLTKQKLLERKVREWVLAVQIEKRYTKKEIFSIYCNQMYLGHGAYGVEAASRLYFNKSNKELNLEEAALIGGIFQTPERQSPFVDMKRATSRRNVVLQRMADEHYITQAQADEAKSKPIVTRGQPTQPPGIAPFFVEEVRKHLERQYGAKILYESGLTVTTTLDARLQELAGRTIEHGLRTYDKRHGWRRRGRAPPDRPLSRRSGPGRIQLDQSAGTGRAVQARRRHRGGHRQDRRGDGDGCREARADAPGRGGADRDRQPHRPNQGDGGRLELLAEQVQPVDPGVPAAGLDVQADRLHGRDRSRVYRQLDDR